MSYTQQELLRKQEGMMELCELRSFFRYDKITGFITWARDYSSVKKGDIAGYLESDGYTRIRLKGKAYQAHRLAWILVTGTASSKQIDHINGSRSDNRWENLREATDAQNKQNRRKAKKGSATGILGVHYKASEKKYVARIRVGGKQIEVGRADTPELAGEMYLLAKRKHHEFCTI